MFYLMTAHPPERMTESVEVSGPISEHSRYANGIISSLLQALFLHFMTMGQYT